MLDENEFHLFPRLGLIKILAAREDFDGLLAQVIRCNEIDPTPELDDLIKKIAPP